MQSKSFESIQFPYACVSLRLKAAGTMKQKVVCAGQLAILTSTRKAVCQHGHNQHSTRTGRLAFCRLALYLATLSCGQQLTYWPPVQQTSTLGRRHWPACFPTAQWQIGELSTSLYLPVANACQDTNVCGQC